MLLLFLQYDPDGLQAITKSGLDFAASAVETYCASLTRTAANDIEVIFTFFHSFFFQWAFFLILPWNRVCVVVFLAITIFVKT